MISKELFVESINKVKEFNDWIGKIEDVFGCIPECIPSIDNQLVQVIADEMGLEENDIFGNDISFFCWELDFGREWTPTSVVDLDDNPIDISTPEKLYDYLTRQN